MAEKSQQPTPKKLRDAHRDGKVARSAEFTGALTLSAVLLSLYLAVLLGWDDAMGLLRHALLDAFRPRTVADAASTAWTSILLPMAFATALSVVGAIVATLVGALQARGVFSVKAITPELDRLNPVSGFKRIFSARTLMTFVSVVLKVAVILAISYWALEGVVRSLHAYLRIGEQDALRVFAAPIAHLMFGVAGATLCLAAADLIVQHLLFIREMRQDKDEVREDYKSMEGDPLTKSRRRNMARAALAESPVAAARRSTVFVTNPTHLCIGIRYDPDGDAPVPVVTIKTADAMAQKMRNLARDEGVPIVEWVFLARKLFAEADVDAPVPDELFGAVADVLAWVQAQSAGHALCWEPPDAAR